jgi:predicted GIY-YIG superfamily endonuclease
MKEHYVYKIVDKKSGNIEYIGETCKLNLRFNCHVANTKFAGSGTFAGRRNEIEMQVIKTFPTKKEAFDYQCKVQKELGFKTDSEKTQAAVRNADGIFHFHSAEAKAKAAKYRREVIGIPVIAYCKKSGKLIGEYQTIHDAAAALNADVGNVNRCVNGIRYKSVNGYIFKKK